MASELGEFLRSNRQRIGPDDVNLPSGTRRRVPGLRREEVALLSDVSVDYYMRLEQGRETSPSPQVADAISRALKLDDHARSHLYRLAGLAPQRVDPTDEHVDPDLLALMQAWPDQPAICLGRAFDVLATNQLGHALFGGFAYSRNLLESIFLDPAARQFYADWRDVAEYTAAGFRLLSGAEPDDARLREVLASLLHGSADFREIWNDRLARGRRLTEKTFCHPDVGMMTLRVQAFDVRSSPGQELVVYRAEPGTASAEALERLRARADAAAVS